MISIIIVSKDNESGIDKTLNSIICADNTLYEVIIKRFAETDTIKVNGNTTEISGPDRGIYDAMNIATKYVQYDWISYMNAGDKFACSLDTLMKQICQNIDKKIIYGDTFVDDLKLRKALPTRYLRFGSAFCHQSTIIRSDIIQKEYDLRYKHAADYELFVSLLDLGNTFKKINLIISNIESGGVSDKNRVIVYREWRDIQTRYFKCRLLSSALYVFRIIKEHARSLVRS